MNKNQNNPISHNKSILNYMQNGKSITAIEALNSFGCFRLASRINDLKKAGNIIQSEFTTTENGKRVKRYFINN